MTLEERELEELMLSKIESGEPIDDEAIRYWSSRTPGEKMEASAELTRRHYRRLGIDIDAVPMDKTVVRVTRHDRPHVGGQ